MGEGLIITDLFDRDCTDTTLNNDVVAFANDMVSKREFLHDNAHPHITNITNEPY